MSHEESDKVALEHLRSRMMLKVYFVISRHIIDASGMHDKLLEHLAWLINLEKAGKILASGPTSDRDGRPGIGLTILRAEGFDEAHNIARTDPFIISGVAKYDVAQWQVGVGHVTIGASFSDQTVTFS